jgi:hypothetical protein
MCRTDTRRNVICEEHNLLESEVIAETMNRAWYLDSEHTARSLLWNLHVKPSLHLGSAHQKVLRLNKTKYFIMLVTDLWYCNTGLHALWPLSCVEEWLVEVSPCKMELPEFEGGRDTSNRFEFIYVAQTAGLAPLIIKASWSHSGTPQSVLLLWSSDQPGAETSAW